MGRAVSLGKGKPKLYFQGKRNFSNDRMTKKQKIFYSYLWKYKDHNFDFPTPKNKKDASQLITMLLNCKDKENIPTWKEYTMLHNFKKRRGCGK